MRALTEYVARVCCESLPDCPGEFFVPAYLGAACCPSCGSLLYPENNGRNGGPQLYDPETHEPWSPYDVVLDEEMPEVRDA